MHPSLFEINKSAYQYQEAVAPQFQSICAPLFELGIKYFDYLKIFNNGSYLRLINNLDYSKTYLSSIKDNGQFITNQINNAIKNELNYFTLDDLKLFDKKKDPIPFLLYDFNMWNSFLIYKANDQGFIEFYIFQMTRADEAFLLFYKEHFPILKNFSINFNEKAKNLIDTADTTKLAYFAQTFNFDQVYEENLLDEKIEHFLQATYMPRIFSKSKNDFVPLTKREVECLHHLSQGKTMKEIGRSLDLSPKTIEFYLSNIKAKSGYSAKSELLGQYKNHSFNGKYL